MKDLRVESRTHTDRFYLIIRGEGTPSFPINVQEYNPYYTLGENKVTVKHYAYCGIGKFCKTIEEAYDWIEKRDRE